LLLPTLRRFAYSDWEPKIVDVEDPSWHFGLVKSKYSYHLKGQKVMKHFGKLAGAALLTGIGLWTIAMPAHAGTIAQFGESVQIFNSPSTAIPGGGNVLAVYANVAGNYSSTAGITLTSNDTNAVLNYSPNPALQFGGLTNGTLDLTSQSGVADVSGNLATGATHIFSSTSPGSASITESST
jgi:hypothetical protein